MYQYYEVEEEAKKLKQLFIHRILKQAAFKKWRRMIEDTAATSKKKGKVRVRLENVPKDSEITNFPRDPRIQRGEGMNATIQTREVQEEKQQEVANEVIKQESNEGQTGKPVLNLKFGDIIYLKYYDEEGNKGIISGDGIASNKLECLPQKLEEGKATKSSKREGSKKQQASNDGIIQEEDKENFSSRKDYLDSIAQVMRQQQSSDHSILQKSAEQQFRKCLFRITNEKKYFYQEKMKKARLQSPNDKPDNQFLSPKVEQEEKENEINYIRQKGSNISYGQIVQLHHIYSDCTVTLNPQVLAKQNCCRELSLEEKDSILSNFVIHSLKDTKKFGEPVLYGDQIKLQNCQGRSYWFNVETTFENQGGFSNPLEVNASEFQAPLKLCSYLDYQTSDERDSEQLFKGKVLQSGEVIRLFNRSMNGYIGVRRKSTFSKILKNRVILFVEDSMEQKMKQEFFDKQESIELLQNNFELYAHNKGEDIIFDPSSRSENVSIIQSITADPAQSDTQRTQNVDIQTLWEIQKEDSFSSTLPLHNGKYRLKNLASGLYLSISSSDQLSLTFESSTIKNLFNLMPVKKDAGKDEPIRYSSSIFIQWNLDLLRKSSFPQQSQSGLMSETRTVALNEKRNTSGKREVFVNCVSRQEKQTGERYHFEILPVSKDLRQTTDRVSSLFPFLFDFYIFLQDWGHQKTGDNSGYQYTYKQAFDSQKLLYNKALEFQQSIYNLQDFLKVNESVLRLRQDVIRESGLLMLLILVLQQIDFKIFGKQEQGNQLSSKTVVLSERSAQKIAQQKLKRTISLIYETLIICIRGNSTSSSFVISKSNKYLEFFLKQLNKYSKDVKQLVREAIKWMDESDEKEQDTIKNWCDKIKSVTSSNVGIQIFIMEVLSLSIVDPLDVAIEDCQKFCRSILFKTLKEPLSLAPSVNGMNQKKIVSNSQSNFQFENKRLLSFKIIQDTSQKPPKPIPCVIFNLKSGQDGDQFEKENPKLKQIVAYRGASEENQSYAYPLVQIVAANDAQDPPEFAQKGMEQGGGELNASFAASSSSVNKKQNLKKYEQYVISVLQFYAQMAKGRNFKIIRLLQSDEIGLTDSFINTCIRIFNPFEVNSRAVRPEQQLQKSENFNFYQCFLALYQEIMLDCDPLLRISESKVNNMVRKEIKMFKISDYSYKIFHDFVLSENRLNYTVQKLKEIKIPKNQKSQSNNKIIDDEDENEYLQISELADKVVWREETIFKISNELTQLLFSTITKDQMLRSNSQFKSFFNSPSEIILKTILQMLKIVHSRIDLGYNNLYTNSHIMKHISNIFHAFIAYKKISNQNSMKDESEKTTASQVDQRNWLFDILVNSFTTCTDSFLITKVVLEASKIISVLDILQRNLVIVSQIQQNMGSKIRVEFKPSNAMHGIEAIGLNEYEMVEFMKNQNHPGPDQLILLTTENDDLVLKEQKEANQKADSQRSVEQPDQKESKNSLEKVDNDSYELKYRKTPVGEFEFDIFRQSNFNRFKGSKTDSNFFIKDLSIGGLLFETLRFSLDNPNLQKQLSAQLVRYIEQNMLLLNLFDQIEVIDDDYELQLLRDLCGDTNNQISSKDMIEYSRKITKYFELFQSNQKSLDEPQKGTVMSRNNIRTTQSIRKESGGDLTQLSVAKYEGYLLKFSEGLKNVLELFELPNYEKEKKSLGLSKTKEEYLTQFQNLLRNTSFFKSVLMIIQSSHLFIEREDIKVRDDSKGTIKDLISAIIQFLYLFVKDNPQNREEILPYFQIILQLPLFQYDAENTHSLYDPNATSSSLNFFQTFKNRPLKITKLCIELLKDKKVDLESIKEYIEQIFSTIEKNKTHRLGEGAEEGDTDQQAAQSLWEDEDDDILGAKKMIIMRLEANCQLLKVLVSLTRAEQNKCIKHNQQKIMDNILSSHNLSYVVKPMTNKQIQTLNKVRHFCFTRVYFTYKMHERCLVVLANCCKNHRLQIQEIHRFISSDSLKNNFTNNSIPFLLRRAYLQLLFETYIAKDDGIGSTNKNSSAPENAELMPSEEIAEIIEYIYKVVDPKNNYQYLEGLVKIQSTEMESSWGIRHLILQEKINEGKNNAELSIISQVAIKYQADRTFFRNAAINGEYVGILKDPAEYWKFVLNEGVSHFLTDTFDERILELGTQEQKSSSLREQYSKIKKMFENITKMFNKLETSYRMRKDSLNLDYYKNYMALVNDIIPKYKSQKAGESFKIGVNTLGKRHIETFNTRKEDLQGGGFQDVVEENKNECELIRVIKLYLMRNRLSMSDLCTNLTEIKDSLRAESSKPILKNVLLSIFNRDKYYATEVQVSDFLIHHVHVNGFMHKPPYFNPTIHEFEPDTDFTDQNLTKVFKFLANLPNALKPEDIPDVDQELPVHVTPFSKKNVTPQNIIQALDIPGIKDTVKIKLMKQARENYGVIRKLMNSNEMSECPFTHYRADQRSMEEVFILQILVEQIKKSDINLFCESENPNDNQDDFDEIEGTKKFQSSIFDFIESTKKIFSGYPIFFIRFLRILMEIKQINQDTIEDKISKNKELVTKANKQIKEYKRLQTAIGKAGIHVEAFSNLTEDSTEVETIESLVLLEQLLNFGSSENQEIILNYLKSEKNVCLDFFSDLRNFFQNKSKENLTLMKESRRMTPRNTIFFEVCAHLILKVLQLFCENVNEPFQNFLRSQNEAIGSYSANTNVIMETSNFLSFLLEDQFVSIDCKSILIRQSLETLIDFSTGGGKNQSLICSNKRLFSFIQDKILDMRIDFIKPTRKDKISDLRKQEMKIDLLKSCMRFLIVMVENNEDKDTMVHILNNIDSEKMLKLLYVIYRDRIQIVQQKLVLEQLCPGKIQVAHKECNHTVCVGGYITDYDRYLFDIGFQIFMMFCYLRDQFPSHHSLTPFTQMLNSNYKFNIFDFKIEEDQRHQYIQSFQERAKREFAQNTNNHKIAEKKSQKLLSKLDKSRISPEFAEPIEVDAAAKPDSVSKDKSIVEKEKVKEKEKEKEKSPLVRIFLKAINDSQKPRLCFDKQFNTRIITNDNLGNGNGNGQGNSGNSKVKQGNSNENNQIELQSDGDSSEQKVKSIFKIVIESIQDMEMQYEIPRYFFFFKNQVGITEIATPESGVRLFYFQKPFCSNFISPYIKRHLIFESNRESDEDRLLFMVSNYEFYFKQLVFRQWLFKYWFQSAIASWRIIKDVQFFFLILIVCFQIFFLDGEIGDSSGSGSLDSLTQIFTWVQLILSGLVLILCAVERFKISIHRYAGADSFRKMQYLKSSAGLLEDEYVLFDYKKKLSDFADLLNPVNFKKRGRFGRVFIYGSLAVTDPENLYHLCYLGVTIAGFYFKGPLVYAILLLDIIKRSHSLQQIIKSITQNVYNIFIFAYLGIVVMYIYGIGAFYYFRPDFLQDEKAYNNTFILAVTSVINMGLRNGGGISESLQNIKTYTIPENNVSENYYWGRYFYDISFFILINMLFIQIIFGIILDTFGELRKQQDEINHEVLNKCFICSMSRGYIDSNSEDGWYDHIYLRHNAHHMVFFLIYIKLKDETECNSTEKYVKKQLEQKLLDFIPVRQSSDIKEQEEVEDSG